jgi:hypothetical protein
VAVVTGLSEICQKVVPDRRKTANPQEFSCLINKERNIDEFAEVYALPFTVEGKGGYISV